MKTGEFILGEDPEPASYRMYVVHSSADMINVSHMHHYDLILLGLRDSDLRYWYT